MPEAPPPPPAPTVVGLTTAFSLAASLAARFGLEHPNDTNINDDSVGASPADLFGLEHANDTTNEQMVEAPTLTPIAV